MADSGAIDDTESHSSNEKGREERYIELSPAACDKQKDLEQRMKKVEKKLDRLR